MINTPLNISEHLKGKVMVLLGGSSGIGKAVLRELAMHGVKIFFGDLDTDEGLHTQNEFQKLGLEVHFKKCDISKNIEIDKFFEAFSNKFESADIYFNSAAVAPIHKLAFEYSSDEINYAIQTNLIGMMYAVQKILKYFILQNSGIIINCGSLSASRFRPKQSLYSMTKAALVGYTKALALDYADRNIRVYSLNLCDVQTPLLQRRANYLKVELQAFADTRPIKRLTQAKEVADLIAFLSSPFAGSMTGVDIDFTGGRSLI